MNGGSVFGALFLLTSFAIVFGCIAYQERMRKKVEGDPFLSDLFWNPHKSFSSFTTADWIEVSQEIKAGKVEESKANVEKVRQSHLATLDDFAHFPVGKSSRSRLTYLSTGYAWNQYLAPEDREFVQALQAAGYTLQQLVQRWDELQPFKH